jgi:hypothetical protein
LLHRFENLLAEAPRRAVVFFARQAEFLRIEAGHAAFDVELGELRHARQRHELAGRQHAPHAEQARHRHAAQLSALRELLHRVLHLLLRLRELFEGAPLRRYGVFRVERAQFALRLSHRAAGFLDVLRDLRIERGKELEQRFQLVIELLRALLQRSLPPLEVANAALFAVVERGRRNAEELIELAL